MSLKLNAKQLRKGEFKVQSKNLKIKKNDIYIILDNVLDTYNIGSIFRLSDALACRLIYLCGDTETPPNHRIKKASINTTEWVEWKYAPDAVGVIKNLKFKIKNLQVVAIEQTKNSIPFDKFNYKLPIALVVGNETTGVSKEALELVDEVVELPMYGVNISLNVMISLGIVLYKVIETTELS
ncbi:TrmH family RNA methyltransferase [Candidatus Daviesbacteria bacterium]|nr:TrmH family RNA methyltransferase [Candidatus Daviesbacteria bacterium]